MSTEYGKVIVGESVDETANDPLIARNLAQQDIEAQTFNPVVGQPVEEYSSTGGRPLGVYGTYQAPVIVVRDPREQCAFMGCLFSWIPIVGFITFCINCDAPMHSRRSYWSNMACIVATVVLFFNLIFWPLMYGSY